MSKPKKRKLVRGKDWHGWAIRFADGRYSNWSVVNPDIPPSDLVNGARWVRVKFVEVKP